MYVSKPKNGFVLPVVYIENDNLFRDNIGRDVIVEEKVNDFKDEKRDRLFDDDEVYDKIVKVNKTYNNEHENINGLLVFDDLVNTNDVRCGENRETTEVEVENVGKLIFEEEQNKTIAEKEIEVKSEKVKERDNAIENTDNIPKEKKTLKEEKKENKKE